MFPLVAQGEREIGASHFARVDISSQLSSMLRSLTAPSEEWTARLRRLWTGGIEVSSGVGEVPIPGLLLVTGHVVGKEFWLHAKSPPTTCPEV
jgi:hypothetical protein